MNYHEKQLFRLGRDYYAYWAKYYNKAEKFALKVPHSGIADIAKDLCLTQHHVREAIDFWINH